MTQIKLTSFSHGAGCGCKISPAVLNEILKSERGSVAHPRLLVGNDTRDDAAVYDLGNGTAMISTADFFMPVVDDPFDFGRIASANAISDVYAMGGTPLMAIAILGWPVDKISAEVAGRVIDGSRAVCEEAGIPLGGGHSIDCPEPVFGLAVTGMVDLKNLRKNSTAKEGDFLFLTKPLGIGILTTAAKKGKLREDDGVAAVKQMSTLNRIGMLLGKTDAVHALTDVTGFGLLGHLSEMCEGSGLSAELWKKEIPLLAGLDDYLSQGCVPGGTLRNWKSYGHKISALNDETRNLLCDPQTNGGLLAAVSPDGVDEFQRVIQESGLFTSPLKPIGKMVKRGEITVNVTG